MNYSKIFLIVFLILSANKFYTQNDPVEQYRQNISTLLAQMTGGNFILESTSYGSFVAVDPSDTNISNYTDYDILDPDSLLNGYVLFTATDTSKPFNERQGFVGVYKNGIIKWFSNGVDNGTRGRFIGIRDLNNNGSLEIITGWISGFSGLTEQIWIFSWNGSTASIINEVDENGYSEIYMDPHTCVIQDVDGNGIYEILGQRVKKVDTEDDVVDSVETKVYSWNGSKFGYWPNPPAYTPNSFTVANNLNASVHINITRSGDFLIYNYSIQ
ncbi:MAG: hypothetical protein R6W90_01810, partial [Ignavibacteriaceae bacterium]